MSIITEDSRIREILTQTRRVAVIGLSSNPDRASYGVAEALQSEGFDIVPVNPNEDKVLGENAFPDLRHVTGMVDVVDVFRASEHVPQIVDACIERGVRTLWLQEGVIHHEAAQKAVDAGIEVVMDRCMLKEYRRLLG
ncbi:O-acetylhomoserine -lyase protein [Salinisphaera shabanensis E1L3A]|uniref:O-acetylhomoserine -lyase protein n=1 Tax=Salinisphaera shabanensis E1L3A TaxID=1033802 RepID=U2FW06_9GAMM|nr:CoA-binding protein [Salinisphaera shabanensis]ERJ20084.1 O-acetylhomoserine -lyase protein [Salinisphaera shabanensis E1L3A]